VKRVTKITISCLNGHETDVICLCDIPDRLEITLVSSHHGEQIPD